MAKEQQQRVGDEEQPEVTIELSELVKKKTISLQMCAIYVYKLIGTRWIALYVNDNNLSSSSSSSLWNTGALFNNVWISLYDFY